MASVDEEHDAMAYMMASDRATSAKLNGITALDLDGEQLYPALSRSGLWAAATVEQAADLAVDVESVSIAARTVIMGQGELGDRLYVVITGKVKITQQTPRGDETLLALLGSGDLFGELSLFDPGPRTSTARTVTRVHAASIDRQTLWSWIDQRPELAVDLLRLLATRLRRTTNRLNEVTFSDVPGRVAKQLLELADRFGTDHPTGLHIDHQLSQRELGQLCGASREAVNQALLAFAKGGLVMVGPGSVTILDYDALARRAR